MLNYYLPGLDTSKLSDAEFIQKVAHLSMIRKMEGDDKITDTLKSMIGE